MYCSYSPRGIVTVSSNRPCQVKLRRSSLIQTGPVGRKGTCEGEHQCHVIFFGGGNLQQPLEGWFSAGFAATLLEPAKQNRPSLQAKTGFLAILPQSEWEENSLQSVYRWVVHRQFTTAVLRHHQRWLFAIMTRERRVVDFFGSERELEAAGSPHPWIVLRLCENCFAKCYGITPSVWDLRII